MRNKLSIVSASILLLALAFTFSCSNDDKGGGWLSCDEVEKLDETCGELGSYYDPDYQQCMIKKGACNGTSAEECLEHYMEKCYSY